MAPKSFGYQKKTVDLNNRSRYFDTQLRYDHNIDQHPTNTQAVVRNQHRMVRKWTYLESKRLPIHLLDVGCGWGDFSNQLEPCIESYIGLDPSLSELALFHQKHQHYCIRGIGEDMSFLRNGSRNFILLNSVLDHCIDWRQTFEGCFRILSPGGLMIISMENMQKLPVLLKRALGIEIIHEGHIEAFTLDDMLSYISGKNLVVEEQRTIGFLYGLHYLTQFIPIWVRLLEWTNRSIDLIARFIYPKGGHIFFVVARKPGEGSDYKIFENPFQCPKCKTAFRFGDLYCNGCGLQIPYLRERVLNALEFVSPLWFNKKDGNKFKEKISLALKLEK